MREIKFRAFNKVNKKWIDAEFLYTNSKREVVTVIDNNENHYSLTELELMQFTGLLDKNGKEIYEGDIVKTQFNSINKIEWKNEGACYWLSGTTTSLDDYFNGGDFPLEIEVIGNIYENPELVNRK